MDNRNCRKPLPHNDDAERALLGAMLLGAAWPCWPRTARQVHDALETCPKRSRPQLPRFGRRSSGMTLPSFFAYTSRRRPGPSRPMRPASNSRTS